MSNPAAPFCNISVATPPAAPLPGLGMRTIPSGATLPQAIQIMNQNMRTLFNGFNGFNGYNGFNGASGMPGPSGQAGAAGKEGKGPGKSNWTQSAPVSATKRIFNQQDTSQFVDIVQATSITLTNKTTGEVMVITAPGG